MEESELVHQDLDQILRCAQQAFEFHAGVIYYADMETETLIPGATVNCNPKSTPPPRFEFSARALVSKAFRDEEPAFSDNPIEDTPNVSREGLEYYGIRGPLLAVPLIIPGTPPEKVGSLAVFNRGQNGPNLQVLSNRIEPFAQFAARIVARLWGQRQTIASFTRLREMLKEVQHSRCDRAALRAVLNGLCNAAEDGIGFDRVRAYSYDASENCFRPLGSAGMPDPDEFLRFKAVSATTKPYAKFTAESAATGFGAREYGANTALDFGLDSDGVELGKLPDLPWAVVPLVVGGDLLGQIAGDNTLTRRRITSASLEFLDAVGAVATGVVAYSRALEERKKTEEEHQTLDQWFNDRETSFPQRISRGFHPHLQTLYEMTAGDVPAETVVRRLLVFATSGETLSFHRAIFLRFQKDRRGGQDAARITFEACIGSLDEGRFGVVGQIACRHKFRELLVIAGREGEMRDEDLETRLLDLDIWIEQDSVVASLLNRNGGVDLLEPGLSHLARLLQNKIGLKRKSFQMLAVIVRLPGGDPVGMILVDRPFKNGRLTSADFLLLEIFAIHAGTIFQQNSLWSRIRKAESELEWKWAAFAMRHGLSTPTAIIDSAVRSLLKRLERPASRADDVEAQLPAQSVSMSQESLAHIVKRLRRTQDAVRSIKNVLGQFRELAMLDSPEKFVPVPLSELLAGLEKPTECILEIVGSLDGIKVQCSPLHLALIFKELVRNAEQSFDSGDRDRTITIEVRRASASTFPESLRGTTAGFAVVSVQDNGRGIPAEQIEKIWELNYTTRTESGGSGYGLWFLRYVVEKHGGSVEATSKPGYGSTFVLYLPLSS